MALWRVMTKALANGPQKPGYFLADTSCSAAITSAFNIARDKGFLERLPDGRYSITPFGLEWVNGLVVEYVPFRKSTTGGRADNSKAQLRATWLRAFPVGVSITPVSVLL